MNQQQQQQEEEELGANENEFMNEDEVEEDEEEDDQDDVDADAHDVDLNMNSFSSEPSEQVLRNREKRRQNRKQILRQLSEKYPDGEFVGVEEITAQEHEIISTALSAEPSDADRDALEGFRDLYQFMQALEHDSEGVHDIIRNWDPKTQPIPTIAGIDFAEYSKKTGVTMDNFEEMRNQISAQYGFEVVGPNDNPNIFDADEQMEENTRNMIKQMSKKDEAVDSEEIYDQVVQQLYQIKDVASRTPTTLPSLYNNAMHRFQLHELRRHLVIKMREFKGFADLAPPPITHPSGFTPKDPEDQKYIKLIDNAVIELNRQPLWPYKRKLEFMQRLVDIANNDQKRRAKEKAATAAAAAAAAAQKNQMNRFKPKKR